MNEYEKKVFTATPFPLSSPPLLLLIKDIFILVQIKNLNCLQVATGTSPPLSCPWQEQHAQDYNFVRLSGCTEAKD